MRSPHLLAAAGVSVAVAAAAAASAVGAVVGAVVAAAVVVVVLLPCLGNVIHLVECCEHESTRAGRARRRGSSAAAACVVRVRARASHGLWVVSCVELCSQTPWLLSSVFAWFVHCPECDRGIAAGRVVACAVSRVRLCVRDAAAWCGYRCPRALQAGRQVEAALPSFGLWGFWSSTDETGSIFDQKL